MEKGDEREGELPSPDETAPEPDAPAEVSSRREVRQSGASGSKWLLLAVFLVGGLWFGIRALQRAEPAAGAGGGEAPAGPPPATVLVATVVQEPVQERRRVVGTLRAAQRAAVAAQEEGVVSELLVDVGHEVAAGEVLARIDSRRLQAQLDEAAARLTAQRGVVAEREAEVSRAYQDLKMKSDLFAQRAVAERELLDAQREAAVAEARLQSAEDEVQAAEATLELLRVRLADAEVRAPFAGRIVARHLDPGEWVGAGGAVVTMVSTGVVEAWLQVPERFLGKINGDGFAAFDVVAEAAGLGSETLTLRQVGDVDPVTRLFPVIAEIDDLEGRLAPGLSIMAELPVGDETERVAVPVDAVIESFSGAVVFRAAPPDEEGLPVAERVPVEVAFRRAGYVYIADGALRPGDLVVVEGNERLFPGTPLMVAPREGGREGQGGIVEEVRP